MTKNPIMKEYTEEEIINTKDHGILIEVLRRENDDMVSRRAAKNPNCPSEALTEVLRRGNDDLVSYWALKNPNILPEALIEVLKRNKNDWISGVAMRNPNCPPKAKLEWYEKTGQLTKYNPEIHELEKTPEDKDLEELRKLL